MALGDILLKLLVDTGDSKAKINEISKEIETLKTAISSGEGIIKLFAESFKSALKETLSVNEGQKAFNSTLNQTSTQIKSTSDNLSTLTNEVKNNSNEIKNNTSVLSQQSQAINQNINALKTEKIGLQENTIEFQRKNEVITTSLNILKASSSEIKNQIAVLQLEKQAIVSNTKEIKEQRAVKDESILALKNEKVSIEQKISALVKEKNINTEYITSISLSNKEIQNNISLSSIQKNAITTQITEEEKLKNSIKSTTAELLEKNQILNQKNLTKSITTDFSKALLEEENRLRSNQKNIIKSVEDGIKDYNKTLQDSSKQENSLSQAEKDRIKEIYSKITALKLDRQEIQNYIKDTNTQMQKIKGITQVEKEQKVAYDNLSKSLTDKSIAITREINKLDREAKAIKDVTIAKAIDNSVIQDNIKALQDQKAQLNTNEQSTFSLRNVIWELTYAYHGLVEGIKIALGLTFTEWSREFDKNMYNTQSIALETTENFNHLKESVIEISKKNNYSGLVGLSDALYQVYSGGFKMAEALTLVEEADRGALGGLANTKDVLSALIAVMHSFGLSANQAGHLNDVFLKTVQDGIITMPELTRYIGQASSLAPELGLHIEDVASAYVMMTKQGINAAESTTAINSVLKTFLDPSKEASTYAKELGINLSASAFEGKTFAEVIADIAKKGDTDAIGKIFGTLKGIKGFFKLAKDEGEQFIKINNEMFGSLNNTQRAIAEQRKSFNNTMTELKNAWEIFMQSIGETVQTFLTPVIKFFANLIKGLNELPSVIKILIASFTSLGFAAAGTALSVISVNQALKTLGLTVTVQTIASNALATSYKALGRSAVFGATGLVTLGTAMKSLMALGGWTLAAGWGALKIGEGIGELINLKKAVDGLEESVDGYYGNQKQAQEKVDLYKNKTNLGIDLNPNEKHDYAQALVQADPKNKDNKALALELTKEYNLKIENERKTIDKKEKMNLAALEKSKNARNKYENEGSKDKIDNLVFEATHSEFEIKKDKKRKEYDDEIKIAKDYSEIKNITEEQREVAKKQVIDLEIAKLKELDKLNKEFAEKEVERKKALVEKLSKIEYKNQGYENRLNTQGLQEKQANFSYAKGDINESVYQLKLAEIEQAKKKIYSDIKNNTKLSKEVRDDAEIKSYEISINMEIKKRKTIEDDIKREVQAIKDKHTLEINNINHLLAMGEITKSEALKQEIKAKNDLEYVLSDKIKKAPKNSKELDNLIKERDAIKQDKNYKKDEKVKEDFEQSLHVQELAYKKEADDNESLFQLKLKNEKDYLLAKIDTINREIEIEELKYNKANDDEKKNIKAKIENLENQKKLADYNANEKYDNSIKDKYNKQIFDDEKKTIDDLKNLKLISDESVYKISKDNLDTYLSYLQTRKKEFEDKGLGAGGDIGGQLGSEEYQKTNNDIKEALSQRLVLVFNTNEEIIKEEKRVLQEQLSNLDLYSNAFAKFGTALKSTSNDFLGAIGSSFTELTKTYTQAVSVFKDLSPLMDKNRQNNNIINNSAENKEERIKGITKQIDVSKLSNGVNDISDINAKTKQIDEIKNTPTSSKEDVKKANKDAEDLNKKIKNIGIGLALSEIADSVTNAGVAFDKTWKATDKYANSLKEFGKDSKQAKESLQDLTEANLEWVKAIPGIGGLAYAGIRAISDSLNFTVSEKEKKGTQEIKDATANLAKTKMSNEIIYSDNKIKLLDFEAEKEKESIMQRITNTKAQEIELQRLALETAYKKQQIADENASKLFDIEVNLTRSLRGLAQESYGAKLDDSVIKYNKAMKDLQTKYNFNPNNFMDLETAEMFKPVEMKKEELALMQTLRNDQKRIEIDQNKDSLSILASFNKSRYDLQEDSLAKTLAILDIEQKEALAILEYEQKTEKYLIEDYNLKKAEINNNFLGKRLKAEKDNADKIRDLNDKNYNLELKAIDATYGKKTSKVKSELDKQIQIIEEYNQKVKDLSENREQDQALKDKRKTSFITDLSKKRNELQNNGAFFTSNQLDFEGGNGLTTGNETLRQKAETQFEQGLISFEEKQQKITDLALQKYVYYEQKLAQEQNPEKRKEYQAKLNQATKDYYEFIIDKEKEKLDEDKKQAEKKKILLKQELIEKEEAQATEIKKLDDAYKTSSGIYKNTFVQATKDWVDEARKQTIEKLGVDTFNTIQGVGNEIVKNQTKAKELLAPVSNLSNPTNNNTQPFSNPSPNSIASSGNNNTNSNGYNASNVFGPFDIPKTNPSGVSDVIFTPTEIQQKITNSGDLALRQKILANIYSKYGTSGGFYDNGYKMSTPDLIKLAQSQGIPLMKDGGPTPNGKAVIAGEAGREFIFTDSDALKMYQFMKNPTNINNSNSNQVINIYNTVSLTGNYKDSKEITSIVKDQLNDFKNKIANNINK